MSEAPPLKIHQAYIVQSSLFYFPAFLEAPDTLVGPLHFLAQGDMQTLREKRGNRELRSSLRRVRGQAHCKSLFIRRVGPILNPLAQAKSVSADDWDTRIEGWLIPRLEAPHTKRGHLPYLVPANWSFRLLNAPAQWPEFHLRPSLKLHIFPYGVVDALLCTEFFSKPGLDVGQFTRLINGLSHVRRRRGRGAVFEVANANSVGEAHLELNTSEILNRLADKTLNRALFANEQPPPRQEDPLDASLSMTVFLNRVEPPFSPKDHAAEICALMTGMENWQGLDDEYVAPYAKRDYGRYEGDYVRLGRYCSVVRFAQPGHRGGRRVLGWNLLSRMQLARIEAFLYTIYAERLNDIWFEQRQVKEKAWEALKHWASLRDDFMPEGSLFYFWDDLLGFSLQSLGGHRRVYERAAELANVEEKRGAFAEELSAFMKYGLQQEPWLFTAWKRLSPLYKMAQPFLKGGVP